MTDILGLFSRTQKRLRAASDEAMSRHGVRVGQNVLLELLWENDGLTPGAVARALGVATPTVVKSAARMEAGGLITKRRDEHDARLVRLYLTERGRAVHEPVQQARRELEERVTATLTEQERVHLRSALGKMYEQLAGQGAGDPAEDAAEDG
ncbi:MarR family transcriptional regulator [Streptomyces sp. V4-01]|uniref:MarR family transcriptional regulator n=1 Tax=Actinacidiphila polyblastidii TaxID=3110430 RepID=A0ABU7PGT3_9ACTN|nr:MarR family transcriptional regulator [Streptomyces sp. V4-01]